MIGITKEAVADGASSVVLVSPMVKSFVPETTIALPDLQDDCCQSVGREEPTTETHTQWRSKIRTVLMANRPATGPVRRRTRRTRTRRTGNEPGSSVVGRTIAFRLGTVTAMQRVLLVLLASTAATIITTTTTTRRMVMVLPCCAFPLATPGTRRTQRHADADADARWTTILNVAVGPSVPARHQQGRPKRTAAAVQKSYVGNQRRIRGGSSDAGTNNSIVDDGTNDINNIDSGSRSRRRQNHRPSVVSPRPPVGPTDEGMSSPQPPGASSRLQRAVQAEGRLQLALEELLLHEQHQQEQRQQQQRGPDHPHERQAHGPDHGPAVPGDDAGGGSRSASSPPDGRRQRALISFPDIRECNAALATFGDQGDLLRALRLYFKMRKAGAVYDRLVVAASASSVSATSRKPQEQPSSSLPVPLGSFPAVPSAIVPVPTMATYSTLMSRAISLGKPSVAVRVWRILRQEPAFFTATTAAAPAAGRGPTTPLSSSSASAAASTRRLVPDIKAANILMNAYAKMGDLPAAEDLMEQLGTPPTTEGNVDGGGPDLPYLRPNLVTYNTLLDACRRTGELDRALRYKEQMLTPTTRQTTTTISGRRRLVGPAVHPIRPDARTFTTLIATVARSKGQTRGGENDPTLAFDLLQEMKDVYGVAPNGMTYSALIDACGRCRRSDLALQGLRWMLQDDGVAVRNGDATVGAWTAAINACGKAGRIETAAKLFFESMPRFGVRPNTVTCGCLTDCLLRYGGDPARAAEYTVQVLRYMKQNDVHPSEVMYTSLMTYATRLAHHEAQQQVQQQPQQQPQQQVQRRGDSTWMSNEERLSSYAGYSSSSGGSKKKKNKEKDTGVDDTKAVNIYSELMATLIGRKKTTTSTANEHGRGGGHARSPTEPASPTISQIHDDELFQVSLVFQEMKASGVVPDLACYNALLRSCANVGNVNKAQQVLNEILEHHRHGHGGVSMEPNNRTWREMLRVAGQAKRTDILLQTWKMATSTGDLGQAKDGVVKEETDGRVDENGVVPLAENKGFPGGQRARLSAETFRALLTGLLKGAWEVRESDRHTSIQLYRLMIKCYKALVSGSAYMGMDNVDPAASEHPQVIASLVQAVVTLEELLSPISPPAEALHGDDADATSLQTEDDIDSDQKQQPDPVQLERQKLRRLAASMAMSDCLYEGPSSGKARNYSPSVGSNRHFVRALQTAKRWTNVPHGDAVARP
jgi:pentatricopeptide repeat protein